jgi:hypothetical protein
MPDEKAVCRVAGLHLSTLTVDSLGVRGVLYRCSNVSDSDVEGGEVVQG